VVPNLVPDFIALRGDPSDGLPGAPGIGPKTAAELLDRYGSLEAVIAAADDQRPRIAGSLRDNADELMAFRDIATLRPAQVPLPDDAETNLAGGAEAARRLGMRRLAERLEAASSVADL
jgi:DNA polymerase-1